LITLQLVLFRNSCSPILFAEINWHLINLIPLSH